MGDVRSNWALEPESSGDRDITAAIILASNPLLTTVVCGMTVLERMVSVLRNTSIPRILIVLAPSAEASAQERPCPQSWSGVDCLELSTERSRRTIRQLRNAGGKILLFTSPVVLDGRALEFLGGVVGNGASCVRMCGPGEQDTEETAAFLAGAAFIDDLLASIAREGGALSGIRHFPRIRVTEGVFQPLKGPGSRRLAQAALLQSLGKPTDGFLAKWIDRRVSRRLSSLLVQTSVTPNALTLLSLVLALAGAVLLSLPDPLWSAGGALLFLVSTVLDGCDGEVARLKHKTSARGARLDLLCDNVALIAIFLGIVIHVYREFRQTTVLFLAAAVILGMIGCMISEYLLILRPRVRSEASRVLVPRELHTVRVRWYERFASRDFAYVLPLLAYFGLLRPLMWAAAIGVNVFWLVLVAFVAKPAVRRL